MAILTVNTTAKASINGSEREFSSSISEEVNEVVDTEASIGEADAPVSIFSVTPGVKTGGSTLESFKFLGIKNTGSSVIEIMIKVLQYKDNSGSDVFAATASPFHQNPYISTLLYPGQNTIFNNPRMIVYNEDIGGTAPESAANADQTNNVADSSKSVTGGTDRGPTDGNGYATHSTHWGEVDTNGIVPGSYVINFYAAGYQEIGMTNTTNMKSPVNINTNTFLAANTAYAFNIAVNGGSAATIAFTTDTSNTNLGNPLDSADTGVLRKIQAALDANSTTNGVVVSIVDGDIRFTSPSRKSDSAIALATPSSGTTMFGVGILPAIGNVDGAVAAGLEETQTPDAGQTLVEGNDTHLMIDNGNGTLSRIDGGYGYIDYDEGGDVSLYNCPPNAEFHVHFTRDSAHSGEVSSHATTGNIMYEIFARTCSRGRKGKVKITAFN